MSELEAVNEQLTLLESVINVEQRQVVSIDVCKAHLRLVGLLLHLIRSHKTLRDFKRSRKDKRKGGREASRVAPQM